MAVWNGTSWSGLGSAEVTATGEVGAVSVYGNPVTAGGNGVCVWDTGAIDEPAAQLTATSDTATGDIWLATKSPGNPVELRRYTTCWAAPSALASGVTSGDVGVLFDALNNRGMALWAAGAALYKKDFDATLDCRHRRSPAKPSPRPLRRRRQRQRPGLPATRSGANHFLNRRAIVSDSP